MSAQEAENVEQQSDSEDLALTPGLKIALAVVFGVPATVIVILLFRYALRNDAKPSELGLGTILVFCLTVLAIIFVPWHAFGLRLSKIGFLEFKEVIKTQKYEQSESIAFLQGQIDALKQAVEAKQGLHVKAPTSQALPTLLERFFQRYPGRFFSPWTVKQWSLKHADLKELSECPKEEITQALTRMFSSNQVRTKISKHGNTLYGVRRR